MFMRVRYFRFSVMGCLCLILGSCSSDTGRSSNTGSAQGLISESTPRFAAGPIATACQIHNRNRATTERCGCIQAAANITLSKSQQERSVRFFAEPDLLQTVKASDTPENERFWDAWDGFAETAEALCS